jgi:hypothetical protein
MTKHELRRDVLEGEIQGTSWAIESLNVRIEFINTLTDIDEIRQHEKDFCDAELLVMTEKINWLNLKLEEINAIIDSQGQ